MNILAICSALNHTYIGLLYNDKKITKIIESDKNYHSLYLISKLKEIFKLNSFSFNGLDFIAVNTGQGSFTGIRVAMTVAKVMAGELNLPLVPLNTTEILLKAYNSDLLIMDARRDMYFLGDKNSTILIQKEKIKEQIKNKKIVSDKKYDFLLKDSICYEDFKKDLGETMLEIAEEKYLNSKDKDEFNYLKVQANYIQTPPVF